MIGGAGELWNVEDNIDGACNMGVCDVLEDNIDTMGARRSAFGDGGLTDVGDL